MKHNKLQKLIAVVLVVALMTITMATTVSAADLPLNFGKPANVAVSVDGQTATVSYALDSRDSTVQWWLDLWILGDIVLALNGIDSMNLYAQIDYKIDGVTEWSSDGVYTQGPCQTGNTLTATINNPLFSMVDWSKNTMSVRVRWAGDVKPRGEAKQFVSGDWSDIATYGAGQQTDPTGTGTEVDPTGTGTTSQYKYTEYENWQIKYGTAWDWSDNMTKVEDGLFKIEIRWEGTGFNVGSDENPIKKDWYDTTDPDVTIGEEVIAPVNVDVYLKVIDDETLKIGVGVVPTEAEPTATESQPTATEFEPTATATEAEPTATATEAEPKIYHAIANWSDTEGIGYTWLNPNGTAAQVQVYSHNNGTNGTWGEFAALWSTLESDQYVEIVYSGEFGGISGNDVAFDSRVWAETGTKSTEPVVSVSDNEIIVRVYGPLTSRMMDPNLGISITGEGLTAISNKEDTHVAVTIYAEGAEPTETEAEPTETEPQPTESGIDPTATGVNPTATGVNPSESGVNPSETGVNPSESGIDPTATGAIGLLMGDANDDDVVNMKDVLAMRKYIAGMDVTLNAITADVNVDGAVNMKDVLAIRKYMAGIESDSVVGQRVVLDAELVAQAAYAAWAARVQIR